MYSSDEQFQWSREDYFGVYFPSCEATREINNKITLEWAQKQFVTSVHKLFYFLHDITNPQITIKTTIFTHRSRVSLARFSYCWWRHNRLLVTSQRPDNQIFTDGRVRNNCICITFNGGLNSGMETHKTGSVLVINNPCPNLSLSASLLGSQAYTIVGWGLENNRVPNVRCFVLHSFFIWSFGREFKLYHVWNPCSYIWLLQTASIFFNFGIHSIIFTKMSSSVYI